MPRIRCNYIDCVFLDDGFCSAASVELDPDIGCVTYSGVGVENTDQDWDVEEQELEEWDDIDVDDDDLWLDDDEF